MGLHFSGLGFLLYFLYMLLAAAFTCFAAGFFFAGFVEGPNVPFVLLVAFAVGSCIFFL